MGDRRFLILGLVLLTGCSATKFSANKADVLSKQSVMSEDASGTIRQPGEPGKDANGTVDQPGNTGGDGSGRIPQTPSQDEDARGQIDTTTEVPVVLLCSDARSQSHTNLKKALTNALTVELKVGSATCTTNAQTIKNLVLQPTITRANLAAICPSALPAVGTDLNLNVLINGTSADTSSGTLTVLYARNRDTSVPSEAADANCDRNSSPLVVHTASDINNPLPIALSSQEDGVQFDLLGKNGDGPVQISWFTNSEYRMLALPNRKGEVDSIDELFGDNTAGPDGTFADNGYAALAKYDGKTADGMFQIAEPDGMIDQKDPIFRKLRLWQDANRDGLGSRQEMIPLARVGIVFIDLNFSTDYAEKDQYGNETKMKSVVGYRDGSLDLIFDLWFAYR